MMPGIHWPMDPKRSRVTEHYRSLADAQATGKRRHGGIDIAGTGDALETLLAVEDGRIEFVDLTAGPVGDTSGIDIMLLADSGRRWWYGHASAAWVRKGDRVRGGETLGREGSTGTGKNGLPTATGPHLHLELHHPAINVEKDPWPVLREALLSSKPKPTTPKPTTPGGPAVAESTPRIVQVAGRGTAPDRYYLTAPGQRPVLIRNTDELLQLRGALPELDKALESGALELALGPANGANLIEYLEFLAR